jgi:ATP-dependent DNA helicase RecG
MHRQFSKESVIRISGNEIATMIRDLPFKPTAGELSQEAAVQRIVELLAEPYPMDILLTADVGVGKTLVYMLPAVAAQRLGRKVAVMIPNSILVAQVAAELRECFPATPVVAVGDAASARGIDLAANPILIGTTGLIAMAKARCWVPDLLVIDESQKTSREQRQALRGSHTNVIEATATALPRTLALVTHGGKQLIQVAKHHANKMIETRIVTPADRASIMASIRKVIAGGGQAAIIYPRVAGQADGDNLSVEEAGKKWEVLFPGQVAVLHGKMKDVDKAAVMAGVKAGDKALLCSSSIIEIGATIKNLKLLMVVAADRYGISTLHQMRGRLVRHGGEGFCFLYLAGDIEEETMERLKLMEKTNDGFRLAEMDMALRGFGDLGEDSEDQSGASYTLFRDLTLMPEDFES